MKTSWFCGVGLLLLCCLSSQTAFAASQPLDYDANGNLISGKGKFYEYNDANKLVRVREGSKEGPVVAQYWYNFQGQRVKKVENGITTYYIGKQYEERKGPSTNEKTNFYFAGGQRVARKTQKDNKPAETFYYLNNHLGSAEVVTNAAGTVVDRLEYYPYGSIRNTGSERYSYTGKEKDTSTGQFYYEARYYDASAHHFTQADTVTPGVYDPQNLNRYAYVNNNPLKYTDPSGHYKLSNAWEYIAGAFKSVDTPQLSTVSSYGHVWKSNISKKNYENSLRVSSKQSLETSKTLGKQKEFIVAPLEIVAGAGEVAAGILTSMENPVLGASMIYKGAYKSFVGIGKIHNMIKTDTSSDLWHAPSEMAYKAGNKEWGYALKNGADFINLLELGNGTFISPYKSLMKSGISNIEYIHIGLEFVSSLTGFGEAAVDEAKKIK